MASKKNQNKGIQLFLTALNQCTCPKHYNHDILVHTVLPMPSRSSMDYLKIYSDILEWPTVNKSTGQWACCTGNTYFESYNGTLTCVGSWVDRLQHLEGHIHGSSIETVATGALEDEPKPTTPQKLSLLDHLWPHQVPVTQIQENLKHEALRKQQQRKSVNLYWYLFLTQGSGYSRRVFTYSCFCPYTSTFHTLVF